MVKESAYHYYTTPDNRVICTSTYAGKTVRGIAKCADSDVFDIEFGKRLAKARVDYKVARKREERAHIKYIEAVGLRNIAIDNVLRATYYYDDAIQQLEEAEQTLKDLTRR